MIKREHPHQPLRLEESGFEPRIPGPRAEGNGAELYGMVTLGAGAGVVIGILSGTFLTSLFAGMGAGVIAGLGLMAGKVVTERLRRD
jgi:hypothetical protein